MTKLVAGGDKPTLPDGRQILLSRTLSETLHDSRLWLLVLLVAGISSLRLLAVASHVFGQQSGFYMLLVSAYLIPVVFAGLHFGVKGSSLAVLGCYLSTLPSMLLFDRGSLPLCVILELGITSAIGLVITYIVGQETIARHRAELTGARLAQLNATVAATISSLQVDDVLSDTVAAILGRGYFAAAWILYAPEGWDERQAVAMSGRSHSRIDLDPAWERESQLALAHSQTGGRWVARAPTLAGAIIVPLTAAGKVCGILGVVPLDDNPGSPEDQAILLTIAGQLGVALDNIRNYEEVGQTLAQLAETQGELERYMRMANIGQEEERRRLARELHDDTLQALMIAKTSLQGAAGEPEFPELARVRLLSVENLIEGAIDNLRRFSRGLRPSLLDHLGLGDAVEWLVNDTATRSGIDISLAVLGAKVRLDRSVELAVFRIVQEALRNVERHSAAAHCRVRLHYRSDSLNALVVDDGQGFPVTAALRSREDAATGLRGMYERARLVEGSLTVTSRPGEWTLVAFRLFWPARQRSQMNARRLAGGLVSV